MIIAWMVYGTLITLFVLLGAVAAESLAKAVGYPLRWIWTGALVLSVVLVALAPFRGTARQTPLPTAVVVRSAAQVPTSSSVGWTARYESAVATVRSALDGSMFAASRAAPVLRSTAANRAAAAVWMGASICLLAALGGGLVRVWRARRRWPKTELGGATVRVAPSTGPLVVGVMRPEIVVPRWLLERPVGEQHLVVAHERQHVLARDTGMLGAAYIVAALLPWCAALWYMLSRLRLAVELDCDARVLRGGVAARSYGTLLIDVAEKVSHAGICGPALVVGRSHLQRRLIAMKTSTPHFVPARVGAALAICALALLAACEAKLPTAADVASLDAETVRTQAARLGVLGAPDTNIVWIVDLKTVSADEAKRLAPKDSIATVNVVKTPDGANRIVITTIAAARRAGLERSVVGEQLARGPSRSIRATGDSVILRGSPSANGKVLTFIDGVRATAQAVQALNPRDIASIEVLKGAAAAAELNTPEAANGVIRIRTKAGASKK